MSAKLSPEEIEAIERRLSVLPEPDLTDADNPEWTEADFAKAQGPEALSAVELTAFPKTRGRPKLDEPKISVSLRLDGRLVSHLREKDGWQTRVNDALVQLVEEGRL